MVEKLNFYLINQLPSTETWVYKLEKYAIENRIPIMDPVSIHVLLQILQIQRPKRILEIGTAIGYSALRMGDTLNDAQIMTIERDEKLYEFACKMIEKHGKEKQIQPILGDAKEQLPRLRAQNESFDFIFIDAAKAQYRKLFELADPLLLRQGLIITDNVLFKGYVYQNVEQRGRLYRLAQKIHQFNEWVMKHPKYDSAILPVGDGLLISYKKIDKVSESNLKD